MKRLSLIGILAILCLGADDAKDKANEQDKFQGKWQAIKAQIADEKLPDEALKKFIITFKDDQAIPADNPQDIATFKLDASKKPAEINLVDKKQKVNRGIYRFTDKDTLEVCMDMTDGDRPKEFASPKEKKIMLLVLKKIKE